MIARLALILALGLAAPAGAATPIDLGVGTPPDLVVDPSGAGHVLFRDPAVNGAVYCRIERKARACDVRTTLPVPGVAPNSETLLRRDADGVLIAIQTQGDDSPLTPAVGGTVWASYSFDNGATFSAPAILATGTDASQAAALAPDAQALILLDGTPGGLQLRRAPFAGPDPRVLTVEDTSGPPEGGGVVNLSGGRMLVANYLGNNRVGWRIFAGGDPLDANAWPVRGVLKRTDQPSLVSGPRGVFLLDERSYADTHLDNRAPIGIRSFDTKRLRWRAARSALADQETWEGGSDLSQDARGRLHLVSATDNYNLRGCIMYARTPTRRSRWFGKTTILFSTRSKSLMPHDPKAVAAPDGRGFAAWIAADGHVRVTPLRQAKGRYRPIANGFLRRNCGR